MVMNTAGVVFCPGSLFTEVLTDELYFIFITNLASNLFAFAGYSPFPKGKSKEASVI